MAKCAYCEKKIRSMLEERDKQQRILEDMTESRNYFKREMNNQIELFRNAVGENVVLQKEVERLLEENEQLKKMRVDCDTIRIIGEVERGI